MEIITNFRGKLKSTFKELNRFGERLRTFVSNVYKKCKFLLNRIKESMNYVSACVTLSVQIVEVVVKTLVVYKAVVIMSPFAPLMVSLLIGVLRVSLFLVQVIVRMDPCLLVIGAVAYQLLDLEEEEKRM